jgi:hypothetical protein
MTGTRPIICCELYSEPSNNPFGNEEEEVKVFPQLVYKLFRAMGLLLDEDDLIHNVQMFFCRPIGEIGIFVPDGSPPTRVLRVFHGMQLFPGVPGRSRDQMVTFAFEGDVDGVDAATIAFYKAQLAITADIVVPDSIARTRQLLNAEPIHNILGPY